VLLLVPAESRSIRVPEDGRVAEAGALGLGDPDAARRSAPRRRSAGVATSPAVARPAPTRRRPRPRERWRRAAAPPVVPGEVPVVPGPGRCCRFRPRPSPGRRCGWRSPLGCDPAAHGWSVMKCCTVCATSSGVANTSVAILAAASAEYGPAHLGGAHRGAQSPHRRCRRGAAPGAGWTGPPVCLG
jgi:hypothetical protein